MLCYKYMSYERFVQSVRSTGVYLKVSRPCEFNDPYDCTGLVSGAMSQQLKDTYNQYFKQMLSPKELDFTTKVNGRRLFDNMYRILSLSDFAVNGTSEEMLMWSHYADFARGVRIGIEIDTSRYKLGVVEYKELQPQLDLSKVSEWKIFDDPELRRFLKECLLTKQKSWEYEQERRVVFRVSDSSLKPFSLVDADGPRYNAMMVWKPNKDVIKEVCLGAAFLGEHQHYRKVDSHLRQLLDEGYNFTVCHAVKRRQYGYDTLPHNLDRNNILKGCPKVKGS